MGFVLLTLAAELGEEVDPAVTTSSFGCPRSCECKWKRGKETVNCVNTGFTFIPKLIDSGTQVRVCFINLEYSTNKTGFIPVS